MMKKTGLILTFFLYHIVLSYAQTGTDVEMATGLRSSGKIWVVVLVILTLVIGLFLYLFSIDKKVSKLEKNK